MALYRPHRVGEKVPRVADLTPIDGGYLLQAELPDGQVKALLPTDESATLSAAGLTTSGSIFVQRYREDGSIVDTVTVDP